MADPRIKSAMAASVVRALPRTFDTMRKRGHFRESAAERDCARVLSLMFGARCVQRHVRVHHFSIDVHVAQTDCYVQFDGVYYHGLDRPYEELAPITRRKFDRDRLADAWFASAGLRLVRITDREWSLLADDASKRAFLAKRLLVGEHV